MPLSWNEIRGRAVAFSKEWKDETSEDAEAKSFWDSFFNIFGPRQDPKSAYAAAVPIFVSSPGVGVRLSSTRRASIAIVRPSLEIFSMLSSCGVTKPFLTASARRRRSSMSRRWCSVAGTDTNGKAVDLTGFEQRDIQTLSGGERQRVAIATLFAQAPQLYLLDEPIAYLDLKHQIAMLDLFSEAARERRAAVAMVLHEPALAWRYSDRVLLIHGDGLTEYGPTREMLTAERLSALFQYPLHALECDGRVSFIPA